MTEEKSGVLFYPSLSTPEEIAEHEAGKRNMTGGEIMQEIYDDPDLKPGDQLLSFPKMDQQRQAERDKLKGTVDISKLNKGVVFDYPSLKKDVDPEEAELVRMAESGEVDALADRIKDDLRDMGASEKDMEMVDYFKDIADSEDPAWRQWGMDMAKWVRDAKKGMKK